MNKDTTTQPKPSTQPQPSIANEYISQADAATDAALRRQTDFWDGFKAAQQRALRQKQQSDANWQRKQHNARQWAAWLDALSSVGNMVWATRNAGNLRNPNNTAAAATDARLNQYSSWRDKNDAALAAYRSATSNADLQKLRAQLSADQQKLHNAATGQSLLLRQQANEQARQRQDEQSQYNTARLNEQIRHNKAIEKAAEQRIRASASKGTSRGTSRGDTGKYLWYDKNGNAHYEQTQQTAKNKAIQAGTYHDDFYQSKDPITGLATKRRSGWHSAPPSRPSAPSTQKSKNYSHTNSLGL